jgi:hypothetical protein
MAAFVYNNVVVIYEGYNWTSNINSCSLDYGVDAQDATTFADATKINKAGLKTASATFEGFYSADGVDEPDDVLFGHVGGTRKVFSVFPEGLTDGKVFFTLPGVRTEYSPGASVGEMFAFSAKGEANANLIRPTILTTSTETATGNGTSRQVGAVASTETLYAVLHVTASSGTSQTLDVLLRSDDNSGMSSPSTRVTFSQVTTVVGAQYAVPVVGPITDDWWDANWTITGTAPSLTFVIGMAIAAD